MYLNFKLNYSNTLLCGYITKIYYSNCFDSNGIVCIKQVRFLLDVLEVIFGLHYKVQNFEIDKTYYIDTSNTLYVEKNFKIGDEVCVYGDYKNGIIESYKIFSPRGNNIKYNLFNQNFLDLFYGCVGLIVSIKLLELALKNFQRKA